MKKYEEDVISLDKENVICLSCRTYTDRKIKELQDEFTQQIVKLSEKFEEMLANTNETLSVSVFAAEVITSHFGIFNIRLSPDGKRIFYSVKEEQERHYLLVDGVSYEVENTLKPVNNSITPTKEEE